MRQFSLLFAAVFALAACSDGGSSPADPTTPDDSTNTVYSVALDSGMVDSIQAPAGTVIPVRVHVTLAGAPVSGITVAWTIASGSGLLSASSTTTDTLGASTVLWTLGDTIALNSITAVAGDGSVTWRVTGIAGAASTLLKITSDSSAVVAGATMPLTVRVVDRRRNPVAGAVVEWSSSDGELGATSAVSGETGNSESNFRTPTKPGKYTVTATLPGKASVTFEIVAM
jgi:hypothetical protein